MNPTDSLAWFGPELALMVGIFVILAADLVATAKGRPTSEWPGTYAMLAAAAAVVGTIGLPALGIQGLDVGAAPTWLFGTMLVHDSFSVFFKLLLGLALVATVAMSLSSREIRGRAHEGEYYAILVSSGLGMLLMVSSGHLLMAYLALEFVSLTSYVLTGFLRHNRRSGEAALKYLIYGGVASGAMIYGMSWIFGLTGAMDYVAIAQKVSALDEPSRNAFFLALVLVLAGFGYKIAAVPFHMWAPDVYTGAPIPVTAFLAVGSKAAGFAMLLRFLNFGVAAGGPAPAVRAVPLAEMLAILSFLTMTVGNLTAVVQTNLKRLLAYSSIAHAGYALLGVVIFADSGVRSVLFYLAVYYVMNLGAFWVVMLVANATGREDLGAYRGLAWRGGAMPAVALSVFLFSLAGLPPLGGFVGKFYVFAAAVEAKAHWWFIIPLVVAGVLNSVISLYYYARVVRTMFLDQPEKTDPPVHMAVGDLIPVGFLSVATVVLGVWFGWLFDRVEEARRIWGG